MEEDDLPFFNDEFTLRATRGAVWAQLVENARLLSSRDSSKEKAALDTVSEYVFRAASQIEDDADPLLQDLTPIICRRFGSRLKEIAANEGNPNSTQSEQILDILEISLSKFDREDFADLDACIQQDKDRIAFIQQGKWTDVNLSYDHLKQREQEEDLEVEKTLHSGVRRRLLWHKLVVYPVMLALPAGLFVALAVLGASDSFRPTFGSLVGLCVVFGIEILVPHLTFHAKIASGSAEPMFSARVVAMGLALALAMANLSIKLVHWNRVDYLSHASLVPLAWLHLLVLIVNITLVLDLEFISRSMHTAQV